MASYGDPASTFQPKEVVERLLEITEFLGHRPMLFISSSEDLAIYLDSLGFDIYTLTVDTTRAFDSKARSVLILPNGSRSHQSLTTH